MADPSTYIASIKQYGDFMNQCIEFTVGHMVSNGISEDVAREYLSQYRYHPQFVDPEEEKRRKKSIANTNNYYKNRDKIIQKKMDQYYQRKEIEKLVQIPQSQIWFGTSNVIQLGIPSWMIIWHKCQNENLDLNALHAILFQYHGPI